MVGKTHPIKKQPVGNGLEKKGSFLLANVAILIEFLVVSEKKVAFWDRSLIIYRSSHWWCFARKGSLTNFTKFTGKTCSRVSFLIKLQASGLQLY